MGKEQVQDPQLEEMLCLVEESLQVLPHYVCSLGVWLASLNVVMKSRMMGDYQVRFCERLGVQLPRSTRRSGLKSQNLRLHKNSCCCSKTTPDRMTNAPFRGCLHLQGANLSGTSRGMHLLSVIHSKRQRCRKCSCRGR